MCIYKPVDQGVFGCLFYVFLWGVSVNWFLARCDQFLDPYEGGGRRSLGRFWDVFRTLNATLSNLLLFRMSLTESQL